MNITVKKNDYEISEELDTMVKRFEYAASVCFPNWNMEQFYYGENLIMATIKGDGQYAHFNITSKRVSFNGHTLSNENYKTCAGLTWTDECFNGRLLELVNF